MDTDFLDDSRLGPAIISLLEGDDVRCAVAFWGTGACSTLFPTGVPDTAQIICDISLGSTNPNELRKMGAPLIDGLKHCDKLHAKVYMSTRGAIVCSANASDNGIGFVHIAGLVEAGVLFSAGSDTYLQIATWFQSLWGRSQAVDAKALIKADSTWTRRPRGGATGITSAIPNDLPSLLRTVAADPESFRGVGFVFTTREAKREDRDDAAERRVQIDNERDVSMLSSADRRRLREWNVDDLFTGWTRQEISAWPEDFVCIHRARKRIYYRYYRQVDHVHLSEGRGVVFAERPKRLKLELGFSGADSAMIKSDEPWLVRLFELCGDRGHFLCENGEVLIRQIEKTERLEPIGSLNT